MGPKKSPAPPYNSRACAGCAFDPLGLGLYGGFMADITPEGMQGLMRQAARWAVAAQQDHNPFIRVLHANYAVAYLQVVRSLAGDDEVFDATGIDPRQYQEEILATQDAAVQAFKPYVPQLVPTGRLAELAGEG